MSVFDPIELEWEDEKFSIPPTRVMRAIALVEDVITMRELAEAQAVGKVKLSKIAEAYATLLRYAGARQVGTEDVYAKMFSTSTVDQGLITRSIQSLLMMMVPRDVKTKSEEAGKSTPLGKETAATNS